VAKYFYKPLKVSDDIRLLRLDAGTKEEPLSGCVEHVSLDDMGSRYFEALSYTWGDPLRCRELRTPEGILDITDSAYVALRRLRDEKSPYLIWVDAICIDQTANVEKSHQIRLMPRIYGSAHCTVVYLGEEADNSPLAFRTLHRIADGYGLDDYALTGRTYHDGTIETSEPRMSESSEEDALEAVAALLRRPWFRRAWVLQEFVMSREVITVCGGEHFDWSVLRGALSMDERMMRLYLRDPSSSSMRSFYRNHEAEVVMATTLALELVANLIKFRSQYLTGYRAPFLYLLERKPGTLSSLESDYLFALLGMAEDGTDSALDPDYVEPFEDGLKRYAAYFIGQGKIEFLYDTGLESKSEGFPSWVPGWNPSRIEEGFIGLRGKWLDTDMDETMSHRSARFEPTYSAGGNLEPKVRYDDGDDAVVMEGAMIDALDFVGDRPAPLLSGPSTTDESHALTVIRNAGEVIRRIQTYPTDEGLHEVWWRTLVGNRTVDLDIPPDTFAQPLDDMVEIWNKSDDQMTSLTEEEYLSLLNRFGVFKDACVAWNKRFCLSKEGYVGLVPMQSARLDLIYVAFGCATPFLLRRSTQRSGYHRLVGACYIHGLMNGEGLDEKWRREKVRIH
jgi:hypothetical protein